MNMHKPASERGYLPARCEFPEFVIVCAPTLLLMSSISAMSAIILKVTPQMKPSVFARPYCDRRQILISIGIIYGSRS
jgi:hypothetical protein